MAVMTQSIGGELLETALRRWREVVGREHVIASGEELAAANLATFQPSGEVAAILRPASTAEVQACMRVAHELRVPVYPVSRGRNWGYGSRTPPQGAAVLMELWRMDRIVEFSETLAFVRIQPGVTFQQLAEFLDARDSALQIHATAGPADGSMIGNTLDRGRSHGPSVGAGRGVGDFQVVLPDGRLVHTSSRRFPRAAHAAGEPFPVGPDVAGMFFESNVGIVTEMTVLLTRKWRDMRVLRLGLPDQAALRRVVDAVRNLMLDGVILPRGVVMTNEYRLRNAGSKFPIEPEGTGEAIVLPSGEKRRILPLWPGRDLAWVANVTLGAADPAIGEVQLRLVKEALAPHASVSFEATLANVAARPGPEYVHFPVWSKRTSAPEAPDLDRERIGYIFVAPVAPAVPEEVSHVYETTRDLMLEHGFDPFINLRFWEPRSVVFVGSIVYDLDEPGADERAIRCYERIMERLGGGGYHPYRLPTFAMQRLPPPVDDWGGFWGDVKRALDPHDVLSPGRYDFRYCWPD